MNVAGSTKDTAHELKNISGVEIRSQVRARILEFAFWILHAMH